MRSITIEVEIDEQIYTIDADLDSGSPQTYDYPGDSPEVTYMQVFNEDGCDITNNLSVGQENIFLDEVYDYLQDL